MNAMLKALASSGIGLSELLAALGGVALCLVLLFYATTSMVHAHRQHQRRIARVQQRPDPTLKAATNLSLRRQTAYSANATFDMLIRRLLPQPAKMRARLDRTGRKLTLGQYLLASLALFILFLVAIRVPLELPITAALLLALAIAVIVPYSLVGWLGRRRVKAFIGLFPEAIDLIVRGLKSGLPTSESIRAVGREIIDPVGVEFRQISDALKFGMTLNEALATALPRVDSPEYRFFLISLSIQQETGGNLAETLENLSAVIRRRRQMRLKIKAYSSEAKASAYIIGSLPFIMFAIILMLNYGYASQLYTDPRGVVQLFIGLTSHAIGLGVMAKMVRFEI